MQRMMITNIKYQSAQNARKMIEQFNNMVKSGQMANGLQLDSIKMLMLPAEVSTGVYTSNSFRWDIEDCI